MDNIFLLWLAIVILVTLITRPTSPAWLKEGKAVFLVFPIEIIRGVYFHFNPSDYAPPPYDGPYDFYYYSGEAFHYVWFLALSNTPVGLAEFLRRLYYKQWHRAFWKNFQYGYISTASMYAGLAVGSLIALLFAIGNTLAFLSGN